MTNEIPMNPPRINSVWMFIIISNIFISDRQTYIYFINFCNENEYSFTLLRRFCLQNLTTSNRLGVLLQELLSLRLQLCWLGVLLQELLSLRLQLCWLGVISLALCVVFLFYLSSFCVLCQMLPLSSGLSFHDFPFDLR